MLNFCSEENFDIFIAEGVSANTGFHKLVKSFGINIENYHLASSVCNIPDVKSRSDILEKEKNTCAVPIS